MKKTMAYFVAGMLLAGAATEQPALAAKKKNKGSVKKEAFGKTEDGKKVDFMDVDESFWLPEPPEEH